MNTYKDKVLNEVPQKNRSTLLDLAISAAKDEGIALSSEDTDIDSLQKVDMLLERLHDGLKKLGDTQESEEIKNGAAIEYAAYIINFMEKNDHIDGKWYYHHREFGDNTFPYVFNDQTVFPYIWALKAIESPKTDKVYDKYIQLIRD